MAHLEKQSKSLEIVSKETYEPEEVQTLPTFPV